MLGLRRIEHDQRLTISAILPGAINGAGSVRAGRGVSNVIWLSSCANFKVIRSGQDCHWR